MVVGQVVINMQIILKKKVYTDQNKTFNVDEGSVYIENYNETLDSATIRISHITEPLDLEPFDKVILHDEENRLTDKYMCIDTYTETMESLDPITYSYEISLFSETKELEGILCPNLSITRLADGSHRSIWHYLKQYLDLYDEKIRIPNGYESGRYVSEKIIDMVLPPATTKTTSVDLDFIKTSDMTITNVKYTDEIGSLDQSSCVLDYQNDKTVLTFTYEILASFSVTIEYEEGPKPVFINKHYFNSGFITKYDAIDCPEMQWNAPTLREVLTDLMMVADCIPVVRNNEIRWINLTQKKNDISSNSHINYIQRSQSAEDYVSELKMDVVNAMHSYENEGIKTSVITTPWMTFKAEGDGFIVDTTNPCLYTQFPILNIKHCWIYFAYGRADDDYHNRRFANYMVDLCDFNNKRLIYEKSEYDVLPIERYADKEDDLNGEITQNKAIYFERGSNIIAGFSTKTKEPSIWGTFSITANWQKYLIASAYNSTDDRAVVPVDATNQWYSTYFKIEYETLADCVFTASKDLPPSHNRVIVDNQTNSYVNVYNQGFLEYQKANRLGNKQLFINARYEDDYSNIIKIGDYYNDNIIYQSQYKIYKNHIEVNCSATKDYILRDYFTGVKARIRSWTIASGSEALTRHELNKYYLEFDTKRRNEYIDLEYPLAGDFLIPIINYNGTTIASCFNHCALKTTSESYHYPEDDNWYSGELVSRIIGNSIVFTITTKDNYEFNRKNRVIGSTYITSDLGGSEVSHVTAAYVNSYGGFPLSPLKYVDKNGECISLEWMFMNEITQVQPDNNNDLGADFIMSTFDKPEILYSDISGIGFHENKNIFKDNRESLKMSTQFEVCSRTHDIVFTRKFLELQKYIRTENYPVHRYRVFTKVTDSYDFKNTSVPNDAQEITPTTPYITIDSSSNSSVMIVISFLSGDLSSTTIYITDSDKNTILMVRGTKTFYLNVLKSRDVNIYDDDRVPIGTI